MLQVSERPQVGERQLDVGLAVVLILLEREGDVERGLVLGEVVVALGRAPGDGAEDAAVLLERHLEVPLLQLARTVDDLDAARGEHRPRIAGAERRQRRDAGGDAAGDAAKRQVAVDPQARHQVVGPERLVGDVVDRARAAPGCAPPPSSGRPPACGRRTGSAAGAQRSSAPSMSNRGMLRHEPCATSPRSTARSPADGTRRPASRRRCR